MPVEKDEKDTIKMNESVYTKIARFIFFLIVLVIIGYGCYWIYAHFFSGEHVEKVDFPSVPEKMEGIEPIKEVIPEVTASVTPAFVEKDTNSMNRSLNVLLARMRNDH